MMSLRVGLIGIPLTLALAGCIQRPLESGSDTEARAVAYLVREVPAWHRENGCFSCHNNGDAARALFAARRAGLQVPDAALADTIDWLRRPPEWSHNKGDPGFSDQRLADIQFAAALFDAADSGEPISKDALRQAADRVASNQAAEGEWPIDVANPVGSPATYGSALATYMAWRSLKRQSPSEQDTALRKAEAWLLGVSPDTTLNAAVLLLFTGERKSQLHPRSESVAGTNLVQIGLSFLARSQTSDGGWGPYEDSPAEAFDTALALLALAEYREDKTVETLNSMMVRGRRFLERTQLPDGSWPATTRPSGGGSYAQQMSTTGWATLALLATR